MKKRKLMSNEELKQFYYAVLRVAAFERGYRRKAKELLRHIVAEMLRRGI